MEEKLKIAVRLVFLAFISAVCMYMSYDMGYVRGHLEKEADLKECAEEVSKGCPNVTTYAVMLEKENARLNKLCRTNTQKAAE